MNNVISIIENSKAVYMASVDGEGRPEIRALLNLCNPQKYNDLAGRALVVDGTHLDLYFTTNTSSKKIERIRNNPNVSLYFCEPDAFKGICVQGTADEVTDQAVKESFWQEEWDMYYPLGKTDPDYTIIHISSMKIDGWYGFEKHTF